MKNNKVSHWALKGRFSNASVVAESETANERAAILKQETLVGTTKKTTYFLVVKKEGGHRTTKYSSGLVSECLGNAGKMHKDTLDLGITSYILTTALSIPDVRRVLSETVGFVVLTMLEKYMKKG
jgi:hypothetical protein